MAEIPININGVICDLYGRTITGPVKIVGSLSRTDVGVGGGPIIPPPEEKPPGGGDRPGIWPGPGEDGRPVDPGYGKPTPPDMIWGGRPGPGDGGSWVPPDQVPPDQQPPTTPPPGTVTPVPPPPGSGGWPVNPVVPPPYVVMSYPGVGPVYVTPPTSASPMPQHP